MNHLTELQCSMFVDGALDQPTHEAVSAHLTSCDECHSRVESYRIEQQLIREAILVEQPIAIPEVTPKFSKPITLKGFALVNLVTGLTIWFAQFLWKTVFGEIVLAGLTQLSSIYLPGAAEVATSTALYFLMEGTAMIDAYLGMVLIALTFVTAALIAYRFRANRSAIGLCAVLLGTAAVTVSPDASALDLRRGEAVITVPEDEVVDDTLLIAAETIVVDGRVTGDLFTGARRIVINGSVEGNVVAFGDSVSIHGELGGTVISAAANITLDGATIDGDFWGAGDQVSLKGNATVNANATFASELATIEGEVARDLVAFAETVDISGKVGEDADIFAEKVSLLDGSHIMGDLRFRTRNEDRLRQAENSRVDGNIEFLGLPKDWEPRNRYLSADFYIWQAVRFVAAFLAGFALLWMIPSLRNASLEGGVDGLKTAGIGFISLFMLPVSMVLFAITVVGLPFSLVALFTWVALLYFAKIIVASMIGSMVMSSADEDQYALPLLAGLAIVIIAVNIPGIGGVISFILTIVGMGILTKKLYDAFQDSRSWA